MTGHHPDICPDILPGQTGQTGHWNPKPDRTDRTGVYDLSGMSGLGVCPGGSGARGIEITRAGSRS